MSRKISVEIVGDDAALTRTFRHAGTQARIFDRDVGRATRGALAGSGAFRSLGRSIAFASGGFLAFASAGDFLRKSLDAAKEAQVTQKQLAAQFKASGLNLREYQGAIDRTANRLSLLSGFNNDELKAGFTTIFRTTNNVTKSLNDLGLAADLARAKNLSLNQAALIIAKTEAGNTTLLRRQGFEIKKNATAEQALAQLRQAVAGQARAGTTAQERFAAVLHNTEEIIGSALLPTLNKYLNSLSRWLTKMNESGKLQRDVAKGAHDVGVGFQFAAAAINKASNAYKDFTQFANAQRSKGGLLGGLGEALRVLAVPGVGLKDAIKLLQGAGILNKPGGPTVKSQIKGGEQLFQKNLFGQPVIDTSGFNHEFFGRQSSKSAPGAGAVDPLNRLQRIQIALAQNPESVSAISSMAQFDRDAIAAIKSRFARHIISAKKYAAEVTSFYDDLTAQTQHLAQIQADAQRQAKAKAQAAARAAQKALEKLAEGVSIQFQNFTRGLKLGVDTKTAGKGIGEFTEPLALQLALAKAGVTKTTNDDRAALLRMKRAAERALKSGRLFLQGQIDAYNEIASANSQLASLARGQSNYHAASTRALTAGLHLSRAQRLQLEERIAQAEAHRGRLPNGAAALGVVINGPVHVHANDPNDLINKLQKKARRGSAQRRGAHPGLYLGAH